MWRFYFKNKNVAYRTFLLTDAKYNDNLFFAYGGLEKAGNIEVKEKIKMKYKLIINFIDE